MTPDYERSARKAAETIGRFGTSDPLSVMDQLLNVLVLSYRVSSSDKSPVQTNLDAMTVASKEKYIVIYNQGTNPVRLRFALARELGHIMLGHDDSFTEEIREEEAGCFAHHFLCPLTSSVKRVKIYFRPRHQSRLWEMKCIRDFDSMEKLKIYVADEENKFNRFIGKKSDLKPDDVKLSGKSDYDRLTGWRNCYNVELNGKTVGYCGE